MRDIIIRIIKNIIVYTISILATIGIVFAISWPTGSPTGETVSGVFYDSLKSIIETTNTLSGKTQNLVLRTQYSKDCNDFLVKGWTTKNDCLSDGRWHLIQSTKGVANSDLKNAILNGADVKIRWLGSTVAPNNNSNGMCSIAFIYNNYAYCQRIPHYGGSIEDNNPDSLNYGFNASSPLPHNTRGHLSVSLVRSDGKHRGISIVPRNNTSEDYTKIVARGGGFDVLEWYIRY